MLSVRGGRMPDQVDLVKKLYFGRDAAETDMANGLLREGFLATQAYDAALSGRKTLVIGRKGAGKSAICMQLARGGAQAGGASLIAPDDAAGDELRRFELQGLTHQTAKSLIWRYVFAVQAARHLVEHVKSHGNKTPRSVKAIKAFLKANGELRGDKLYNRVLSGIRGLQEASFSLGAFGVTGTVDIKGQSEGAKASNQLDIIEEGVARAFAELGCAPGHEPFLILVDKLEQVWSGDANSMAMVKGLLLAGQHVAGETYGGAVRCVLFLRSDIYDSLGFDEGDKFHSDEMRLGWTVDELAEVALMRARASLSATLNSDRLWAEVFPPQVAGEEMRSYLFKRVLHRPRDVIQLLNQCRDQAAARGHRRISERDVTEAMHQFSDWKLQDLIGEYQVSYPFLPGLFVVFQNAGYIVTRKSLEIRLEAQSGELLRQYPNYADAFTLQGVLNILYGVGFLGVKRGNGVVYAGGVHVGIQSSEMEFHIHPCFRPALNAVMAADIHPYRMHSSAQAGVIALGGIIQNIRGTDIAIGKGRESSLLDSLVESCETIMRQLGRSDMPMDTRDQVSEQLARILENTAGQRVTLGLTPGRVAEHVIRAADYLNNLATQLTQSGVAEIGQGRRLVRTIQDEASSLIREAGGGYAKR